MPSLFPRQGLALGILVTIISYFFFAAASAFVRALGPSFPTIEILFCQNLFCLIFLSPFFLTKEKFFQTSCLSTHLIRDLSGITSYFTYFFAIQYLNLVDATVLSYTAPFYIPFISKLWMKETIAPGIWWAIGLGFIGLLLVLQPSLTIFNIVSLVAILSGVLSATALTSIRVLNQKKEPLLRTLFYFFLLGTLCTLPFMFFSWKAPSHQEWLFLIGIGSATALAQILLTYAYQHGTASFLSPLSYFTVIFAVIFSWSLFNQSPKAIHLIGTSLIILGGTLSFVFRTRKPSFEKTFTASSNEKKRRWWWF